ncbi:unnamed protein product [Lota lota]
MPPTPVSQGTPFPCLRVLVPPLRLVSAAIWHTVQHRIVTAYGLLDHVITEITEIVPELLNSRQRCLLCFNFQAQLVLDLCRPGQTIDIDALQPHLDRMQTLSSLLSQEVNNSAEGLSEPNMLISLIQRLITDPDNRQHFYQNVFPQKYGPKYCKAVELLVMKFLVALERLLVVPNLQQVANMLGSAPSVLAECVAIPLSQDLKSLLEYQKDCIKSSNIDVLHTGDRVRTAPPVHSTETILIEEETLLKSNMLGDYMDASSREQAVEMATAENASMGFDTKDKMGGGDCVTIQPITVKVDSEKDVACDIQKMVASRRLCVVLDPRAVELYLGCNIKVPEYISHTAAQTSEEDMPPAMTIGEDEKVELCVRTDGDSTSEGQSSTCINMEKEIAVKNMERSPANEHPRNTCMSNVAPASTVANELAPGIRPVRKNRGLKMKSVLMMTPKTESKASKTCRVRKCTGKSKRADSAFHCTACDISFRDTTSLVTHNETHKPRPCTMCDETFNGFMEVNRHYVDVHQFHGPFPCTFCNRVYSGLKGLIRHERVHTSDLPFKCSKCPKAFLFASGLKLHDRTHTKESPFLCWDCGQGCRTNSALKIHRLCRHSGVDDKHLICEHCGKSYAHKQSLDLHVAKVHTGVRYPCPRCSKLFRSASSLKRHDLTHTQERPFPCKDCVKCFRSASELKIHVRYHTGERPFKCQECGKGFVQNCYLTVHMRIHSGEKPYQCPTCGTGFKSAATLKRHSLTHTGEKPHKCSGCEMTFSRHELLKAHMRKFHFTMLESRWSPVLPSSNRFRKRRTMLIEKV